MARFKWDPDVNITKRRPSGMTGGKKSSGAAGSMSTAPRPGRNGVIKSKQSRRIVKPKSRLAFQGTEKAQSFKLMKHWQYRNFRRCGQCGAFDTYKSRSPIWTRTMVTRKRPDGQEYEVEVEVLFWCYKCGAINDAVTAKYADVDPFELKGFTTFCAECGKELDLTKAGMRTFPITGQVDPTTQRTDRNCEDCHKKLQDEARAKRELRRADGEVEIVDQEIVDQEKPPASFLDLVAHAVEAKHSLADKCSVDLITDHGKITVHDGWAAGGSWLLIELHEGALAGHKLWMANDDHEATYLANASDDGFRFNVPPGEEDNDTVEGGEFIPHFDQFTVRLKQ
jgi:hypothetical protein